MKAPVIAPSEGVAIAGAFAVGVGCLLSPAGIEDGPIICPFRLATGLPCPACGLTRSWVYALHGWWSDAFAANPFGLGVLGALVALVGAIVVARVRGSAPPRLDRALRHPIAITVLVAWGVFGMSRLLVV